MYAQQNKGFLPWLIDPGWDGPFGVPSAHWHSLVAPYLGARGSNNQPFDPYSTNSERATSAVFRSCPAWNAVDVWRADWALYNKHGYGLNARLLLPDNPDPTWNDPNSWWTGQTGNNRGPGKPYTGAIRLSRLKQSTQRVLIGESVDYHIYVSYNPTLKTWEFPRSNGSPAGSQYQSGDPRRHAKSGAKGGSANYAFADGHAESLDKRSAELRMSSYQTTP
jgi:prepilin-type processing-associated H-X9-DG protein